MRTVSAVLIAAGQERARCCPVRCRRRSESPRGAGKEGLPALSVGVGLGVFHELMEAEVDEVVG